MVEEATSKQEPSGLSRMSEAYKLILRKTKYPVFKVLFDTFVYTQKQKLSLTLGSILICFLWSIEDLFCFLLSIGDGFFKRYTEISLYILQKNSNLAIIYRKKLPLTTLQHIWIETKNNRRQKLTKTLSTVFLRRAV